MGHAAEEDEKRRRRDRPASGSDPRRKGRQGEDPALGTFIQDAYIQPDRSSCTCRYAGLPTRSLKRKSGSLLTSPPSLQQSFSCLMCNIDTSRTYFWENQSRNAGSHLSSWRARVVNPGSSTCFSFPWGTMASTDANTAFGLSKLQELHEFEAHQDRVMVTSEVRTSHCEHQRSVCFTPGSKSARSVAPARLSACVNDDSHPPLMGAACMAEAHKLRPSAGWCMSHQGSDSRFGTQALLGGCSRSFRQGDEIHQCHSCWDKTRKSDGYVRRWSPMTKWRQLCCDSG